MKQALRVSEAEAGCRADKFVGSALSLSRVKLRELFEAGRVRVNGRRAAKGASLSPGDEVEVDLAEVEAPASVSTGAGSAGGNAQPEPDFGVLYEDESLLILDKPAGVPALPLAPGEKGNLASALSARFPECALASPESPLDCGIAHRLDTQTSGAIAAGRTHDAYAALRELFSGRRGEVVKTYTALVSGMIPSEGEVSVPIAHHPGDKSKMIACADAAMASELKARPAVTRWSVLEWLGDFALVEVRILTGVRHQIRVHLSAIGAPIAGDELYGGAHLPCLVRQFLHASRLEFTHPLTGRRVSAESPLPSELRSVLLQLQGRFGREEK